MKYRNTRQKMLEGKPTGVLKYILTLLTANLLLIIFII